jgi:hypothetical protein
MVNQTHGLRRPLLNATTQYDDEYDDTYDHLDAGGLDADSADELSMPDNRRLPWAKRNNNGGAGAGDDGDDYVCVSPIEYENGCSG